MRKGSSTGEKSNKFPSKHGENEGRACETITPPADATSGAFVSSAGAGIVTGSSNDVFGTEGVGNITVGTNTATNVGGNSGAVGKGTSVGGGVGFGPKSGPARVAAGSVAPPVTKPAFKPQKVRGLSVGWSVLLTWSW